MNSRRRFCLNIFVFSLLFGFVWTDLSAQNISVKDFRLLETDLTANTAGTMKRDQNNEVAALIKIVTTETGFVFDGGMLGTVATVQKTGEIWLYVPQKARKITISHQQLGVLRDYYYPCTIEAGRTYEMILSTGKVTTIVQEDAGGQYVAMTLTPANAEVYIDDILTEVSGGTVSKLLKYGKHTYRITAPLYETEVGQFDISSHGRTDLKIALRPAYGQLQLTSTPPGAEVYIDDDYKPAGTTPFTTERLPKGKHTLQFRLSSYKPLKQTVDVVGDASVQTISATLEPNFAEVSVQAPGNADIYINQELKGSGRWSGRLNTGLYTVEARKESHYPTRKTVDIRAGETTEILLEAPVPRYGSININTTPIGAKAYIDGELLGETPNIFRNILVGTRTLRVEKNGYVAETRAVTIEEGKVTPLDLTLQNGGSVTIHSHVPGTEVFVDGTHVGNAPCTYTAAAGRYTVTARARGYRDATRSVVIVAGQSNIETISPVPLTGAVQITVYPSSANIYVDGSYIGTSSCRFEGTAGTHTVTVSAYGYKSKTEEITLRAGEESSTVVVLKAKRKRLSDYYNSEDLFSLGGGWDILWTDKCSMGGYLSFKMGQEQFTWLTAVLNIGGYKMGKNRGGKFAAIMDDAYSGAVESNPEIDEIDSENSLTTYTQIPISLALRLRLGGGDWGASYIGVQGSYNFNMGDNVDLNVVNRRNYSVGAQFGFCIKRVIDIVFFYTHDLSPAYNQQYIYENMPDFYNSYESHINKRWRFGTAFVIYIPFSDAR